MKKTRMAVLVALVLGLVLVAGCALATSVNYYALCYDGITYKTKIYVGAIESESKPKNYLLATELDEYFKTAAASTDYAGYVHANERVTEGGKKFSPGFYTSEDAAKAAYVTTGSIEDRIPWNNAIDNQYLTVYVIMNPGVTDIGDASGSVDPLTYTGDPAVVSKVRVTIDDKNVELEVGDDMITKHCTLTWYDNILNKISTPTAAGTYYIKANGTDTSYESKTYKGTTDFIEVKINPISLKDKKGPEDQGLTYTGKAASLDKVTIKDSIELTVGEDKDCTIEWFKDETTKDKMTQAPTNAGSYYMEVTGKGNYADTTDRFKVTINRAKITADMITVEGTPYTGSAVKPTVTVKLGDVTLPTTDYVLEYTGNTNVGEATVKVLERSGAVSEGNLTGNATKNFKVTYALKVEKDQVSTYGEIKPAVTNDPVDSTVKAPTYTYNLISFKPFGQTEADDPVCKDSYIYIQQGWIGRVTYTVTALNAKGEAWGTSEERNFYVYSAIPADDVKVETTETAASFTWKDHDLAVEYYNVYLDDVKLETISANAENIYGVYQLEAGSTHVFGIQPVYEIDGETVPNVMPIAKVTFTTQATAGDKVAVESFKVTLNGKSKNLKGSTLKLKLGKKQKLKIGGVQPANATNTKVRWRSSNTSVCTVKNGTLVAKKTGTATITVTARDGFGAKVSFKVKVVK